MSGRISFDVYDWDIEEISLFGSVCLGRCSRSTVYRHAREINDRLENLNCDWRVVPDVATCSLTAVDKNTVKRRPRKQQDDKPVTWNSTHVRPKNRSASETVT